MSGKVRAPSFLKNSGHTPPFFGGHHPSWLAAFETRQGKAYDLPPGAQFPPASRWPTKKPWTRRRH